jgi:tRNA A37 methylthiotransferase MiaB
MLTINKGNFGECVLVHFNLALNLCIDIKQRVLQEAREKTYTRERILSAFEATGIVPLNPYCSSIMQEFRARIVEEHQGTINNLTSSSSNPRQVHQVVVEGCYKTLNDIGSSTSDLQSALAKALAMIDRAEAWAVIAESEITQIQNAVRSRSRARARHGQVGRARVYTQDKIEEVREQEVAHAQRTSTKGCGRGCSHRCGGSLRPQGDGKEAAGPPESNLDESEVETESGDDDL